MDNTSSGKSEKDRSLGLTGQPTKLNQQISGWERRQFRRGSPATGGWVFNLVQYGILRGEASMSKRTEGKGVHTERRVLLWLTGMFRANSDGRR